jgi:hypothetical protein
LKYAIAEPRGPGVIRGSWKNPLFEIEQRVFVDCSLAKDGVFFYLLRDQPSQPVSFPAANS